MTSLTAIADAEAVLPPARPRRAALLRALVGDTRFTVVSNNCWGAHLYQAMGVPYATPFVGLFIPPTDYLDLVGRFDALIGADLDFVAESRSAPVNAWRARERLRYPIAMLGGRVEIDFQHYRNEEEARAAWRRRCARINPDPARRFFKFDDREGATAADIAAFARLPAPNKVCFTARRYETPTRLAPAAPGEAHVVDGLALAAVSRRSFNALRWISARPAWMPLPALL